MKTLQQILSQIHKLERQAAKAARHEFPRGSLLEYAHGDALRLAAVVDHHSYKPRVKVRGVTGKEYWLEASRATRRVK